MGKCFKYMEWFSRITMQRLKDSMRIWGRHHRVVWVHEIDDGNEGFTTPKRNSL